MDDARKVEEISHLDTLQYEMGTPRLREKLVCENLSALFGASINL